MGLRKVTGVIVGIAGILLSGTVVFAKSQLESDMRGMSESRPKSVEVRKGILATTTRAEIKDTMRANIETAREEAKTRIEAIREKAKTRIEAQREKEKEHLADIRDKEKKQKAQHLAEQFDALNQKWTDHFTQQLDRYSAILIKKQERADIAATKGKEVATTSAAIQLAKTAITNAQTAVTAQVEKTYAINISSMTATVATTTESGQNKLMKSLQNAFQDLHKALFKDLYALRDGVMKDAYKSVQVALQTLGKVKGVDDENATSTSEGINR